MTVQDATLLISLIFLHLVGDFILQPSSWIDDRYGKRLKSKYLYAHASIHGALAACAILLWQGFDVIAAYVGLTIGLSHLAVDAAKSYTQRDNVKWFLLDQIIHLGILYFIWSCLTGATTATQFAAQLTAPKTLIILTAYLIILSPFSTLIGLICKQWSQDLPPDTSLSKAGAWIGQLERVLVLTFILINQFGAIGFLLAAKSVLRFGDMSEEGHRKINEYILVGTLTSFSLTILLGLMIKKAVSIT